MWMERCLRGRVRFGVTGHDHLERRFGISYALFGWLAIIAIVVARIEFNFVCLSAFGPQVVSDLGRAMP
jgi:hypothetical protein